jgi:hypothetical protein
VDQQFLLGAADGGRSRPEPELPSAEAPITGTDPSP